jgi:hypothetical protein
MNNDTLINHCLDKPDSFKIIHSQQSLSTLGNDFDITKTLITALFGAFIGIILSFYKTWYDIQNARKEKQKLIIADLRNQLKVLERLANKLNELDKKFENHNTFKIDIDVFHDLQTDIYESVPKVDLHKIFKNNIFKLVDIYKSIKFLQDNSIANIYNSYLLKLEIHYNEKKNEPNHQLFCKTHLNYIELSRNQIKNNLNTISDITKIINEIINSYC